MRVRLPSSIIASIESHLRPDFHPVLSLSTILNSTHGRTTTSNEDSTSAQETGRNSGSLHSGGGRLAVASGNDSASTSTSEYGGNAELGNLGRIRIGSSTNSSAFRDTYQLSTSNSRTTIYDDDHEPFHFPHLLRNSPKSQSHLDTAHQYLSKQAFDPSSPVSRLRRQITYSKMISTFLNHPQGLRAVHTLLQRSLQEGIPISTPTLTIILHSVLSSPDVNERMKIVHGILPLLPEKLDVPLLDVLMRTVIRDTSPEPKMVEKMIVDCLKLDQLGSREKWPLEVWDLLLLAHAQRGDFRGAIKVLAEFKEVIQSHIAISAERRLQPQTEPPRSDTQMASTQLNSNEKQAICKAYATVLNAYRKHRFLSHRQPRRSAIAQNILLPRQLAADLIELLDGERPSTGFLNVWLRIERENGEVEVAESVWKIITGAYRDRDVDGSPWEGITGAQLGGTDAGIRNQEQEQDSELGPAENGSDFKAAADNRKQNQVQEGPDSESWRSLFALYDFDSSTSSRNLSLPPIRTSLRRLFAQDHSASSFIRSSPLLTTPLFKSIVGAMLDPSPPASTSARAGGAVDFPALLVVLQQMRWAAVQPDRKTIDIIASSIMSYVLHSMSLQQQVEVGFHPRYYRYQLKTSPYAKGNAKNGGGGMSRRWKRMGLGLAEWDCVSEVVHQTRVEQYHQERNRQQQIRTGGKSLEEDEAYPEMVYLPLSMPVGRLTGQSGSQYPSPSLSTSSANPTSLKPDSGSNANYKVDKSGKSSEILSSLSTLALAETKISGDGKKWNLPSLIVPALETLIERIIITSTRARVQAQTRISSWNGGSNGAEYKGDSVAIGQDEARLAVGIGIEKGDLDEMSGKQVLRMVMLPVEEEITPRRKTSSS
ncbi:hypothetical protein IAT40_003887 [Kwoniella sp. CBS 6097]